jgi:NAD(P)-dependent dehydrogenase (short-subunit alcohol dehydrogenase family)
MKTEKIALITGAAQGLGKAIALMLAKEGNSMVLADVKDRKVLETKREVKI